MKRFLWAAIGLISLIGAPVAAQTEKEQKGEAVAFEAKAAWQEFEDTFRLFYAYIDRDDMDVERQLAHSKAIAAQAWDKALVSAKSCIKPRLHFPTNI